MNVWYSGAVSTAFIADIKKGIVADPTSAGYGLPVSRITLEKFGGQWDFGDHHYKKGEDGSWVKIDKYRGSFSYTYSNGATTTDNGHDYSKNTPAITGDYYSPPLDNANGCVDRLILAKNEIKKMSETVMKNNSKSAIAWTSFGGELTSWGDFASATPDELIHSLNGYDNTNYVVGLDKAYELLAARKASTDPKIKNRTTFVVFITDGIPNKPGEGNKNVTIVDENGNTSVVNMSVPAAEAVEAAQEIKGISDTIEFYCAGINSGASDTLKYMAKSDSYYKDCKTGDDFKEFLSKITLAANASATVLLDVLGDAYNLVCDSDHKITVRDGSTEHAFSSLSSAIEGGVDFNDPELSWRLNEVTDAGARLSFYVKLDDAMYDSFTASGEGAYQTNKSATLTYHRVIDGTESSVVETIPFDNPATLKIKRSVLTAVKSSDKNEQTVKTGDNIKYTITLNNTGLVDINNVKVSDAVPQESEFVSAENGGTLTDGRVNFTVSSIPAGKTATVSFTVKVLRGNKDIVNHAMFGTEDAADSIGSTGIPVCYTNEVKNPRAYHLLSFSKTVRGNLGDPYKEFEFTVVCKDADGNALPAGIDILFTKSTAGSTDEPEEGTTATDANGQIKFTLRHGQSISFKDVPVGIIEVAEANVSDYTTTYRDSKTGESKVASAGSTGEIGITQYETRSFDFYNVKTMAPPTGAAISVRNTILLMATALLVMAAAWKISAFRRKKRQ